MAAGPLSILGAAKRLYGVNCRILQHKSKRDEAMIRPALLQTPRHAVREIKPNMIPPRGVKLTETTMPIRFA